MKQRLHDDLKAAMKRREARRMMTLRGVLAEVTRLEKDLRHEADEAEIIQIIKRERTRRNEAIEFARKAGRTDLIETNQEEARILEAYLPAAPGAEELSSAIEARIAAGDTAIGPIMKALKERFGARLDGKAASLAVRRKLEQQSG